jgi:hypothetical protein
LSFRERRGWFSLRWQVTRWLQYEFGGGDVELRRFEVQSAKPRSTDRRR